AVALADAVVALLRDPAGARAIGAAGAQRIRERFPITRNVEAVQRVYESLGMAWRS
ncbi:MAG: hypothetical protein HY724_12485, partial [Candidatus Rokubacteria bacterium]|nr:hypothetical protein [Candidatus Rokubacteria bacterium]